MKEVGKHEHKRNRKARFLCFLGLSLPKDTVQNSFKVSTVTFSKPLTEKVNSHHRFRSIGSLLSSGSSCPSRELAKRRNSQGNSHLASAFPKSLGILNPILLSSRVLALVMFSFTKATKQRLHDVPRHLLLAAFPLMASPSPCNSQLPAPSYSLLASKLEEFRIQIELAGVMHAFLRCPNTYDGPASASGSRASTISAMTSPLEATNSSVTNSPSAQQKAG